MVNNDLKAYMALSNIFSIASSPARPGLIFFLLLITTAITLFDTDHFSFFLQTVNMRALLCSYYFENLITYHLLNQRYLNVSETVLRLGNCPVKTVKPASTPLLWVPCLVCIIQPDTHRADQQIISGA